MHRMVEAGKGREPERLGPLTDDVSQRRADGLYRWLVAALTAESFRRALGAAVGGDAHTWE